MSRTGSPASPGEADAAPVVPAPALPVWPPPTNPGGRRDEPAPSSPAVAPRPSSRPGLRPGSAEVAPTQRPGGSDLSAYYAGLESSATVAFPAGEQETSGSLTGHILAQGWADTAAERSRSTLRVVILMAVALGVLVAISVMVVLFANDALPSASSGLPGDRQLPDRW
ncbi:hypothetical protein KBX50_24290 [Micromonospora sp. C51]|uniref:hypothetical protein n=1 Tax=Micromonospora sp. C51 TaxID=2824879 RepID=UPI001B398507|nr:hypothetical protein [Micromonospora sp. C51]MBQ1051578.1 hypothetical protein [Micromonospora sp. C51]